MIQEKGEVKVKEMMKVALMYEPGDIRIEKMGIPTPTDDEVLIKVHCVGICGSDIQYYEHGRIGRFIVDKPIILGHEMSGEIVALGKNVRDFSVGDRVAVEPGIPCDRCSYCKAGRYNLCPDVIFMATPPVDGAWAQYVTSRSDFVYRLPDEASFEGGALLEPLSVGIHAMERGKVKPSDRVLITGLGPIGLMAVQAARLYGVREIYATDVVPLRREIGAKMGASTVINPLEENLTEKIEQLTNGEGVDLVVETSGNERVISEIISVVKRAGRVSFVGLPSTDEVPLNINQIIDSELDVFGVFRYANTYPFAIQMLKNTKLDIEQMITHKFSMDDIEEALNIVQNEKDKSVKVIVYPNGL